MSSHFDVRLHTKERNIIKHASSGALFHRQQAIFWIFTQTKLSNTYRRKFLYLKETSRVACNSEETQTHKLLLLFGRDRLNGKILASAWQEYGNAAIKQLDYDPNISS